MLIWIIVGVAILLICIRLGYRWSWTGFGETSYTKASGNQEVEPKKTLWNWLDLLIVPAMLGLGAVWFSAQQEERQMMVEERRANAVQEAEDQRAQAEALQSYINEIAKLLLAEEDPLRELTPEKAPVVVARARTLSLLDRLDPERKRSVILFLYESQLIRSAGGSVLSLSGERGDSSITPSVIKLFYANLRGMSLAPETYLRGVDMEAADLTGADLSDTILYEADLDDAILKEADLKGANLRVASLQTTDLSEANLRGAKLDYATLTDAKGITNEELEQQAASLEGATMPNGQKYEDWLKDKEGRSEDKKDSGGS